MPEGNSGRLWFVVILVVVVSGSENHCPRRRFKGRLALDACLSWVFGRDTVASIISDNF